MIGQFYTEMKYIGMQTNHKEKGSGYVEILLKPQLVTSKCLNHVLSGKAFAKTFFLSKNYTQKALFNTTKILQSGNMNNHEWKTMTMIESYQKYQDNVHKWHLVKTCTHFHGQWQNWPHTGLCSQNEYHETIQQVYG